MLRGPVLAGEFSQEKENGEDYYQYAEAYEEISGGEEGVRNHSL